MSIAPDFVAFDIECRPSHEAVDKWSKSFDDFDPNSVKCGNLGPEKAAAKIAQAKSDHESERVAYYKNLHDRAALDPITGAIICIGVCTDTGLPDIIAESTEAATLRAFWRLWELRDCVVTKFVFWSGCGDASKKFDIDYIVTRSRINRVPVPPGVRDGRYYSKRIVDLAGEFLLHQRERYLSLTKAADMFGLYQEHSDITPKRDEDPVTGANFYQWWDGTAQCGYAPGMQRGFAKEYLTNDVLTLRYLAPLILC